MTVLAGSRHPSAAPPEAPSGYFDRREWQWRSGACSAGAYRFDVVVEVGFPESDWLMAGLARITRPLRGTATATPPAGMRGVHRYSVVDRGVVEAPFALYCGPTRLLQGASADAVVRKLAWHINHQMVAATCDDYVVLHAAAATCGGLTVMLAGPEEHGKTTTVAGLLRAGYDYVTDEAVVIDAATLSVRPFPKALSVDEGAWPLFASSVRGLLPPQDRHGPTTARERQCQLPAERLGSRSRHTPVQPPRLLVFPRYVGGSVTRASRLTPGESLRELALSTFHFERKAARNLRALAGVVAGASAIRLVIGDLDEAVREIELALSAHLLQRL